MNKKIRTIICGSTFAQFYLEALKLADDKFEVVGLLARGSERSKKCAKNYNIPLYTDISDIPKDIELACIVLRSRALGGVGTDLAIKFMKKGIHVIQEQPIHPKDLEDCYRVAKKNSVYYQTGDLYGNLNEVKKFIRCASELNKRHKPVYVNAAFAPQVSYPAMDILMQALPSIRNWDIHIQNSDSGPFHVMVGKLGDIPITLEIHNEIDPKDPDNYMYLMHNIMIVYESGRLVLEDTFGPVIWNPRLHVPIVFYNRGNLKGEFPQYLSNNSAEILGNYIPNSQEKIITEHWPRAILEDLLSIRNFIITKKSNAQKAQKELLCSAQWNEMTKLLGYANLLQGRNHNPFPVEILKNAAKGNIEKEVL